MADETTKQASKRQSTGEVDDPEEGPSESKKPCLDEAQEPRDPGKKDYRELNKLLRQLTTLVERADKNDEVFHKIRTNLQKLEAMCSSAGDDGQTPNPLKIIQMHLKHKLFNSEKIKEGDNIKNFLSGLEDGSASKSDKDEKVYVFLANFATELWYSWKDNGSHWQWTPEEWSDEKDGWWLWMPCSNTQVTAGQWDGETPAPENVEIINYLDAIRPVPSDEQYLPASHDVVELFSKLMALEDSDIVEVIKAIVGKITTQEVETKSRHISDFKDSLKKLLPPSTHVQAENEQ